MGRQSLGDLRPGRGFVVGLQQTASLAHHLAKCPKGDPVAVGRAAAVVPPGGLDQPLDVLAELRREARLPDSGRTHHADETRSTLAAGGVKELLELAELLVATNE